jgi:hypothetical protein
VTLDAATAVHDDHDDTTTTTHLLNAFVVSVVPS